jgi:hypothetical protein
MGLGLVQLWINVAASRHINPYRATRSLETDVCKGQREDERESP